MNEDISKAIEDVRAAQEAFLLAVKADDNATAERNSADRAMAKARHALALAHIAVGEADARLMRAVKSGVPSAPSEASFVANVTPNGIGKFKAAATAMIESIARDDATTPLVS